MCCISDVGLQAEVGGTWYENVYDGCACDIPSVCYQFTWYVNTLILNFDVMKLTFGRHRKHDWSKYYSGSDEIRAYMADVVKQHNLLRFVKLQHKVQRAEWQQDAGKWKITVRGPHGVFDDYAEFLVNGGGCLKSDHSFLYSR